MGDNNIIQEAIDTLKRLRKENAELKAENARLKSCLQEIKKIAELPSYHSKLIFNEFESRLYKIIDIINKAESEG